MAAPAAPRTNDVPISGVLGPQVATGAHLNLSANITKKIQTPLACGVHNRAHAHVRQVVRRVLHDNRDRGGRDDRARALDAGPGDRCR